MALMPVERNRMEMKGPFLLRLREKYIRGIKEGHSQ